MPVCIPRRIALLAILLICYSPVSGFSALPYRIVIEKSKRTLTLYNGNQIAKRYRIALGSRPTGRKEREGDRRTPEGRYFICAKNAKSQFYLALELSYPNAQDAEQGRRDKLITRSQYESILDAQRRHREPPQHTPLGGELYIHGGGTSTDWTWGCIALENAQIEELFNTIPVGTDVEIHP